MSRQRARITGTVQILTPLHVGTGTFREVETVRGKRGSNKLPGVAALVRDCERNPFIPGTALKGLLVRLGNCLTSSEAVALFGQAKDEDEGGNMGTALVSGMTWKQAGATEHMPYAKGCAVPVAKDGLGEGVFVSARTAIDRHTGTADDNKLFFQEMVAPGAEFDLNILLEYRPAPKDKPQAVAMDKILAALLKVLAELAREGGQPLGKNEADGFGRVRLAGALAFMHETLGQDGEFTETPGQAASLAQQWHKLRLAPAPGAANISKPIRLKLTCEGPFLVVDSSYDGKGKEVPQVVGQQSAKDVPMLLGPSLSGALRARARWLMELKKMRPNPTWQGLVDDPDTIVKDAAAAANSSLSPVQRLFGVTGFAGLLQITGLRIVRATVQELTSVKLDRFTGGPMDNALFKTRAFRAVEAQATLQLAGRGKDAKSEAWIRPDDMDLLDELVADIQSNHLVLGHGGSKGFGWFKVGVVP